MNIQDMEDEDFSIANDPRSEAEIFLTIMAYRPKTKTWDPRVMVDVKELERMRLAGEKLPTSEELADWRVARNSTAKAQPCE